jgi:hypothetical protein
MMTVLVTRYIPHLLLAILSILLVKLSFIDLPSSGILFAEDQALSFATAGRLLAGDAPLLGPPSHIGGRHLGAVFYVVVASCLALAQGDIEIATRIMSALTLISVILLTLLVQRIVNPAWKWWSAVFVLVFACSGEMVQLLRIPWHAHLFSVFVMLFMWASHSLFTKGIQRAPAYLLAATLLVQMHYSAIPLVAVFTLVWLSQFRSAPFRSETLGNVRLLFTPLNLTFFTAACALWVPIVWHDLTFGGNTLLSILVNAGTHDAHAGLKRAMANVGYFFRLFLAGGIGFKELWDDSRVLVYTLLIISSSWFFIRGRSVVREDSRAWILALFLGVPAYILATARQPAPLRTYYLYGLFALPFIYGVIAMIGALRALRHSAPERALAVACILLWGTSIRFGLFYNERNASTGGISEHSSLLHGIEVGAILRKETKELPSTETHTIIGRGDARIIKDAYLLHLGPEYFGQINFSSTMREVSAFSNTPSSPYAFLMVCPNPPPHHSRAMWKEIKKRWHKRSEVDLSTCSTCRQCRMWILEDREAPAGL